MLVVQYQKAEAPKPRSGKQAYVEFVAIKNGEPQRVITSFKKDEKAVFYMWQAIRDVASTADNGELKDIINCAKEFLAKITYRNGEVELYKFQRK